MFCIPNRCATLAGSGTRPACTDPKAPQLGYTCAKCPTGYNNPPASTAGGGLVCKDTNACTNKPCSSLVSCTDQSAPGTGFTCGGCPAGYKGDGIGGNGCTDADDCATRPCGKKLGMSCLDTGTLKYKCNCPPGYSSSGNPLTCNLVNACQASEDDCVTGLKGPKKTAACNHVGPGKHSCTCPSGYVGDGASSGTGCTDPDECAKKPCATLQGAGTAPACTSKNAPLTGFTCAACPTGYDSKAAVQTSGPSRNFLRVNTDSACKTKLALPRPTAAPTAALALQRHHC